MSECYTCKPICLFIARGQSILIWGCNVVGKSKSLQKWSHNIMDESAAILCRWHDLGGVSWGTDIPHIHMTQSHDKNQSPCLHLFSKLLFWPTFHLLTCSRRELWPLLQPTTRGQHLGSCNVVYHWMSAQGDTDAANCHVVINFEAKLVKVFSPPLSQTRRPRRNSISLFLTSTADGCNHLPTMPHNFIITMHMFMHFKYFS